MRFVLSQPSKASEFFAFFVGDELIVLTNCFLKKTQKTPQKEIKMAEKLKREYITEKYGGK
jgi:phage-related protein